MINGVNPAEPFPNPTELEASLFPQTSRYYRQKILKKKRADGREVAYLERRFLPDESEFEEIRLHTVAEGERVFRRSCRRCHGPTGTEGDAPRLVKRDRPEGTHPWNLGRILPIRAPYATVVWDYINRGMPLNREGTLTPDEVYSLTALLLFWNEVIAEDDVMDAASLPMVVMPNRDAWARLPEWKPGMPRLRGYPY